MAEKVVLKRKGSSQDMYPVTVMDCIADFPHANRKPGSILAATTTGYDWIDVITDMNFDKYAYGVEWLPSVGDPKLTRIGRSELHKTLPIQSKMKLCIYRPKDKKVSYWIEDAFVKKGAGTEYHHATPLVKYISDTETSSNLEEVVIGDILVTSTAVNDIIKNKIFIGSKVCIYASDIPDDPWWYGKIVDILPTNQVKIEVEEAFNTGISMDTWVIDFDPVRFDGYDGEVMVYVPPFYIKSWDGPDKYKVMISEVQIDDTWEFQPALFIGAYRDTVLNTVPENMGYLSTLEANTAISVANSAAYCRGGSNNAANDTDEDRFKRQLGKCRTNISRSTFRAYTRKAGKEIMSYRQYKNILYWLWVIEYANFNSQAPYNAELTAEGFHQGGLGNGLTNVSNWGGYNGSFPISHNGYTNEFGNGTGIKLIAPLGPTPVGGVYATRWRGIENPFGDVWHNVDGIIIDADADNHPNNMNYVYTTDDPAKYSDNNIADMVLSGLEIHQDGFIREWDLGSTAEIIPRLVRGDSTQYKCDYHYVGGKNTTFRILLLGGCASDGASAGLGGFSSNPGVALSYADVGFRSVSVV